MPVAVAGPSGWVDAGATHTLDGGQSYDLETPTSSLHFQWTSPSHPSLSFRPSPNVRTPSFTAPLQPGSEVVVELVVSDGLAYSAPSTATFRVMPTEATHIFVDSSAACGAACDGTRARPFPRIGEGVAAAPALTAPKPVLVASGIYGAAIVPAGVSVSGGCEPVRWQCDGSAGPSVIRAESSDLVALDLTGTAPVIGTVQGFTVYGTAGDAVPAESAITGVRCLGCKANLADLHIEGQGSAPKVTSTYALYIGSTGGPVRVRRVGAVAGKARFHHAVALHSACNVTIEDSFFTTLTQVRPGEAPDKWTQNTTVALSGDGHNALFARNRLYVEADGTVSEARLLFGQDTQTAVFVGNFFWLRANAGGGYLCCGVGETANAAIKLFNTGGLDFNSNTFLGNEAAFNNSARPSELFRFAQAWAPASSGTSYFINHYVENFKKLVQDYGGGLLMKNNYAQDWHLRHRRVSGEYVGPERDEQRVRVDQAGRIGQPRGRLQARQPAPRRLPPAARLALQRQRQRGLVESNG